MCEVSDNLVLLWVMVYWLFNLFVEDEYLVCLFDLSGFVFGYKVVEFVGVLV